MISMILPTRGRPERLKLCLERIIESTSGDDEIVCIADVDDIPTVVVLKDFYDKYGYLFDFAFRVTTKIFNAVEKWNYGASEAHGDILVLAEDDLYFHPGWKGEMLAALDSIGGSGYVGLNSLNDKEPAPSDYAVTRDWLDQYQGGMLSIPIFSQCGNLATYQLALKSGKCIWADGIHSEFNAVAQNIHPYLPDRNGAPLAAWDATYSLRKKQSEDMNEREVYAKWLADGMPITWGKR
jgi:glycosyltransferase involved in cell wall biosynthesis